MSDSEETMTVFLRKQHNFHCKFKFGSIVILISSQPIGLEDVSKYPDLFDLLAEEGHGYEPWTRDDLQ